jgi:hypothetical protein
MVCTLVYEALKRCSSRSPNCGLGSLNAECRLTVIMPHPPSLLEILHWNYIGAPVPRRRHRFRRRCNMSFSVLNRVLSTGLVCWI